MTGTVENLNGKVWTPWLHVCVVSQLEKERTIANRYCENGFTSRAITRLLGNITVRQRKNIERFCVKKVSGQMFQPVENSTV